jgi:hypothetical protein
MEDLPPRGRGGALHRFFTEILGGIDALTGKVAQAEATVKHAFSALENAVQHSIIAAYQCKGDCYVIPKFIAFRDTGAKIAA